MRRLISAALLAFTLAGSAAGLPTERETNRLSHLETVASTNANRGGPCRIAWNLEPRGDPQVHDAIVHATVRLFRCAFNTFNPSETAKALDVLDCESGWPWSHQGDSNPNKGAIQYQIGTFNNAYDALIKANDRRAGWNLPRNIYNARSQALVTALFVRRFSWEPWSCA